jgi:hypothetical protein
MVQTEILVEWVIKFVEAHYYLKSKKKMVLPSKKIDKLFRLKARRDGFDFFED